MSQFRSRKRAREQDEENEDDDDEQKEAANKKSRKASSSALPANGSIVAARIDRRTGVVVNEPRRYSDGSIVRIKLHNFMIYRDCEFHPDMLAFFLSFLALF